MAGHVVVPGRRVRVLEVRHEDAGAGVERVDDHLALDRAGDLDAPVLQVGRDRGDLPVAVTDVFGFLQEVRQPAAVQLFLDFLPAGHQLVAAGAEGALQLGDERQGLRGEDFVVTGFHFPAYFHALRQGQFGHVGLPVVGVLLWIWAAAAYKRNRGVAQPHNAARNAANRNRRDPDRISGMIDLYTWPTPNGMKVQIMLEETGLPYTVHPVNIVAGEQFDPAYLALNPNNKVPTITDPDGPGGQPITIMETGAILLYLADKRRAIFAGQKEAGKAVYWDVMQWLMWQMGGLGPMFGQAQHFHSYATEDVPYAKARYLNEGARLLGVLDARLTGRDYICGEYSIVDMASFPWVRINKMCGLSLEDYPEVSRWYGAIRARPAVEVGINVLMDRYIAIANSDEGKETLFGATQYAGGS